MNMTWARQASNVGSIFGHVWALFRGNDQGTLNAEMLRRTVCRSQAEPEPH